jgi:hypothetical protein
LVKRRCWYNRMAVCSAVVLGERMQHSSSVPSALEGYMNQMEERNKGHDDCDIEAC